MHRCRPRRRACRRAPRRVAGWLRACWPRLADGMRSAARGRSTAPRSGRAAAAGVQRAAAPRPSAAGRAGRLVAAGRRGGRGRLAGVAPVRRRDWEQTMPGTPGSRPPGSWSCTSARARSGPRPARSSPAIAAGARGPGGRSRHHAPRPASEPGADPAGRTSAATAGAPLARRARFRSRADPVRAAGTAGAIPGARGPASVPSAATIRARDARRARVNRQVAQGH